VEFRQAQTALSTYFIQKENDFSLAYPTPVLGKPWSIPMEFPLYQWTVAAGSSLTGMSLTSTARALSLLCFYLTLPAVFILLAQWNLAGDRRWLILGLIVSTPLYIFYGRAFLIETMALMFSAWFLLGYLRWIQTQRWQWLIVASLFGALAGLVKVTTFMLYLVPAAVGVVALIWQQRPTAQNPSLTRLGRNGLLCIVGIVIPFVATLWWMHFADAVKMQNPSARFLVSSNMNGYHFGTRETRFAAAIWAGHWHILRESVVWLPLIAVSAVAWLVGGCRWWKAVLLCAVCFGGIQLLLPELYAWHDYYYVANAIFLIVAMGLGVVSLFDSPRVPRWVAGVLAVGMLAGQAYFYHRQYYSPLAAVSPEGDDLTIALKNITKPDEVLLVVGEDWNSMTPYYARRRALMIREGAAKNETELREAFARLRGEKIGALVTHEVLEKDSVLLRLLVEYFGINPEPLLRCGDRLMYFPEERWREGYDNFEDIPFHNVAVIIKRPTDASLAGRWYETASLRRFQATSLKFMHPQPVRFYVRFGISINGVDGDVRMGAHPETRFQFKVDAGVRHFHGAAGLSPGAYENVSSVDASDGVVVELKAISGANPGKIFYSRYLNPRDNPGDRGTVPIEFDFEMPATGEVELSVTAGPNGKDQRDWAYLGPLKIE